MAPLDYKMLYNPYLNGLTDDIFATSPIIDTPAFFGTYFVAQYLRLFLKSQKTTKATLE